MSFVGRIVGQGRAENTGWSRSGFVASGSATGKLVTVDRSMTLGSVFAAVGLRSRTVGRLPLKVYQRQRGGGRVEAFFEDVYRLLHDEPNGEHTAISLWTLVETHLSTWGNAFLGKEMRGGRVVALNPLYPERMESIERKGGVKHFSYRRENGDLEHYTSDEVLHFMGFSLDGIMGLSPISYARHTMGAALSRQEYGGRFFKQSAIPGGVLSVQGTLTEDSAERLQTGWNALHGGEDNAHRIAVLEQGADFKPITIPAKDAQFVEQMKLDVQAIARIFWVPPELIGGESGSSLTYSTVEGQGLHFLGHGIDWDLQMIAQVLAADRNLFPGAGRALFPEFAPEALLRTDAKTRGEFYAMALNPETGWMTREEVRRRENLPRETDRAPAQLATAARARIEDLFPDLKAAEESRHQNGGARYAGV